jgi:hypothetical protein
VVRRFENESSVDAPLQRGPLVRAQPRRRKARQVAQLQLGPFLRLHEIIPELKEVAEPTPTGEVPSERTGPETSAAEGR